MLLADMTHLLSQPQNNELTWDAAEPWE